MSSAVVCQTVLCPHKVCDDLVIQLPVNSTHLRITRPGLQLLQPKPYVVETVDEKVAESVALTQGLHMVVSIESIDSLHDQQQTRCQNRHPTLDICGHNLTRNFRNMSWLK